MTGYAISHGCVTQDLPDVECLLPVDDRYRQCRDVLESRGQEHVLAWWDELDAESRQRLLAEIEGIPWDVLDPLIESHVRNKPEKKVPTSLEPASTFKKSPVPADAAYLYQRATELGVELIRNGKVAAFTVAGGQGTRLGMDGPKGAVPISPIRNKCLFQLFAEMLRAARRRYGALIPWYIMASPVNFKPTTAFLEDHDYFGLPSSDVMVFAQGMLPRFDFEGRLLMADRHRLALAPDGHGGCFNSLHRSGALEDMRRRGMEIISYFHVDNPLVQPFDELFLGLHRLTESDMSTKVTTKTDDFERVGNVCLHDGRVVVVEYTDLPTELAQAKEPDQSRKFNLGNIGIHLVEASFVERMVGDELRLPYHRAEKSATWMDANGFFRTPSSGSPNAVQLETFVFDALPLAQNPLLLEVDRDEEFSPIKNRQGADSVETAVRDQVRRAVKWLAVAGATVPYRSDGQPDVTVEIAPTYAMSADELKAKMSRPPTFTPGETIYIS